MRRLRCGLVLLALSVAATGCAPMSLRSGDFAQPTVRANLDRAAIADSRARFADIFCRHLAHDGRAANGDCAYWFPAAAGVTSAGTAARPVARERQAVVIIPGIFGECVSDWVTPFSQDYRYIEELGYNVHVVDVTGRGSSAQNAAIIHAFFSKTAVTFDRAIVVAYSKGVTDFMLAATQAEAAIWSGRVGAFVSIAGVVNGTPLASRGEPLYRLLGSLPVGRCMPQDRGGVASLSYRAALPVVQAFASQNKPYPSFSIVAVADGAVNPALRPFHALLAQIDRRNDGQVLAEDAIVPGSTFLGAFRADHWSIALPFEDSTEPRMYPLSIDNHFPRRALVAAMLEFVNQ